MALSCFLGAVVSCADLFCLLRRRGLVRTCSAVLLRTHAPALVCVAVRLWRLVVHARARPMCSPWGCLAPVWFLAFALLHVVCVPLPMWLFAFLVLTSALRAQLVWTGAAPALGVTVSFLSPRVRLSPRVGVAAMSCSFLAFALLARGAACVLCWVSMWLFAFFVLAYVVELRVRSAWR